MKKLTRSSTAMGAVAGLTLAMVTAGAAVDSAAAAGQTAAEPEKTCTGTQTFEGQDLGKKANVSLCAHTDGKVLRVTAAADCFWAGGAHQYDHCYASGDWQLLRNGKPVAKGKTERDAVLYPGPGTYTLVGHMAAHAEQLTSPGSTRIEASGRMQRTVTLKAPIADGPRLAGTVSGGADGSFTLTVKNVGNRSAKAVDYWIGSGVSNESDVSTADKRCKNVGGVGLACELGDLAPGASTTVTLKDTCKSDDARGYYQAMNFPMLAKTLCARDW